MNLLLENGKRVKVSAVWNSHRDANIVGLEGVYSIYQAWENESHFYADDIPFTGEERGYKLEADNLEDAIAEYTEALNQSVIEYYSITAGQYERTEYRPLDVETFYIQALPFEDYKDIIENEGGWTCDKVKDLADIMIFCCIPDGYDPEAIENDDEPQYIVQVKR